MNSGTPQVLPKFKKQFLLDFESIIMAWVLSSEVEDTPLQQFFKVFFSVICFYLLLTIFFVCSTPNFQQ